MKTSNSIIENMEAVRIRAEHLNCNVVAVLNDVILCHRSDNTFITWRCSIYEGNKAEFISGCYDMTADNAKSNLLDRAFDITPSSEKTYTVWGTKYAVGIKTYEELLAFEKSGDSVSSQVVTSDIKAFIEAVYNETDTQLYYKEITL